MKIKNTVKNDIPEIKPQVLITDLQSDLRVARVISCEKVAKSDKLLKLQLDIGIETRQVVSGIASSTARRNGGKKVILIANLKPPN